MTFYVGQKVVCVDDENTTVVKKNEIYTVLSVGLSPIRRLPVIGIIGISVSDGGMYAYRFRPLVDSRKSVSFTAGAPKDSEVWDNRKKVVSPRHRVRVNV